jgi:hypothetical protein
MLLLLCCAAPHLVYSFELLGFHQFWLSCSATHLHYSEQLSQDVVGQRKHGRMLTPPFSAGSLHADLARSGPFST